MDRAHQAAQYHDALAEGHRFDQNQPASQWALKKIWERMSQIFAHSNTELHPHIVEWDRLLNLTNRICKGQERVI
jgi:hypothetical protein